MTSDADEREERGVREGIADRLGRAFASVPKPSPPVTRGGGPLADDIEKVLAGKDAGALTADDARDVRWSPDSQRLCVRYKNEVRSVPWALAAALPRLKEATGLPAR